MARSSNPNAKELRKLRNKDAAARSRAVKKELALQREALIEELTATNAALHKRIAELTSNNEQLKQYVYGMQGGEGEDSFID